MATAKRREEMKEMQTQAVAGWHRVFGGDDDHSHIWTLLEHTFGAPGSRLGAELMRLALTNAVPVGILDAAFDISGDLEWAEALAAEAGAAQRRQETIGVLVQALGGQAPGTAWAGSRWRRLFASDVDLIVTRWSVDAVTERLLTAGLMALPRLGTRGVSKFVRIDAGVVVDRLDLAVAPARDIERSADGALGELTPAALAARVARRVVRRREVRAGDVIDAELSGWDVDTAPASDGPAADGWRALREVGGRLRRGAVAMPVATTATEAPRWRRPKPRPRTWSIAFSGIDGSGKTTHVNSLVASLQEAGVPVTKIWNRPGFMTPVLGRLAAPVKRVLRDDARPALDRQLAAEEDAVPAPSRSGLVGWVWLLIVEMTSLGRSWEGTARARRRGGVILYERHLLDALVDIEWQYQGVRKGVHRRLLCLLMPRPDVTARIVVDPVAAADRNPFDIFRHEHVAEHAAIANRLARMVPGETLVIDGQGPLTSAKETILRRVLTSYAGTPQRQQPRVPGWAALLPPVLPAPAAAVGLGEAGEGLAAAHRGLIRFVEQVPAAGVGPVVVWDGEHLPVRPRSLRAIIRSGAASDQDPDDGTDCAGAGAVRAAVVPSHRRHDYALYPRPDALERIVRRGWPVMATGPVRQRIAQAVATTPAWRLTDRAGLVVSSQDRSLLDLVLADVREATARELDVVGIFTGRGALTVRARGGGGGGDVAVRIALTEDAGARLVRQLDAMGAIGELTGGTAVARFMPETLAGGTTSGRTWTAERWVDGASGPGGRAWRHHGRGWGSVFAIADALAELEPTGVTDEHWSERWMGLMSSFDHAQCEPLIWALTPIAAAAVPTTWCHGDLWPGNVVIDRQGCPVAVDWDHARPDAPAGVDAMYAMTWRLAMRKKWSFGRAAAAHCGSPSSDAAAGYPWLRRDPALQRALVVAAFVLHASGGSGPGDSRDEEWVHTNLEPVLGALTLCRRTESSAPGRAS